MTTDDAADALPEAIPEDIEELGEWLEIDCPSCGGVVDVLESHTAVSCPSCGASIYFPSCSNCLSISIAAIPPGSTVRKACTECYEVWSISLSRLDNQVTTKGIGTLMTCGDLLDQQEVRESTPDVLPCLFTVVGGYGWSPEPDSRVTVRVGAQSLAVGTLPAVTPMVVPYDELLSLEFHGGKTTKGGGFFGGGFGITGALEGMLIASVLNKLTTKTSINSIVRLSGRSGETVLHAPNRMPTDLRTMFAPAVNAVAAREARGTTTPANSADLLEKLERLVTLHVNGHLTDEEFISAKQQILGSSFHTHALSSRMPPEGRQST